MVAMAVGQNNREKRWIGRNKTINVRQRYSVGVDGIKRKTKIEQNAQPPAF